MRILALSNLYPPNVVGGYERLCFDVCAALAARGHAITVLTSSFGGSTAEYPGQVVLRRLEALTGPTIYEPFAGSAEDRAAINAANLRTLEATLEQVRPDVVFAWNLFFLDASLLHALARSGVRSVLMLTDNWLLVMTSPQFMDRYFRDRVLSAAAGGPSLPRRLAARLPAPLKRLLGRRVAPPLPMLAVFGSAYMRALYREGGITFARSRVIHNGVKQDAYGAAPRRDRAALVSPGTLHLLFAGRLVDLKGAHTAVAAMDRLDPASLGVDRVTLTIVGDPQDQRYMQTLHQAIARSRMRAAIVLRAPVPQADLFALFQSHDLYLFPSLYEPFALTLIHALACGIPTIASRVGGNPEIVRHGRSGLLFERDDAEGLARAIGRLARDPGLRVRLSRGGQAAAARFGFARMVDGMEAFLAGR